MHLTGLRDSASMSQRVSTDAALRVNSALHSMPDIPRKRRDLSKLPICDLCTCNKRHRYSITSSARPDKGRRHGDTKRLGRFCVDEQFELGALLDRHIAGFFTLEDASDV